MDAGKKGRPVQLSGRLQALADLVTPGSRVADVGCDHGFVSIYLVQQGISPHVIASDVRSGPLSRAREHIDELGLETYIETRLSDGLAGIRAGEADTLICAGMGGRLMQRILQQGGETARSFRELILQPQSELEGFRAFLRREDYRIIQEDILCEDGKYYFPMKAVPGAGEPGATAACGCAGRAVQKRTAVDIAVETIPLRLADKYGGLLLRERHPVLKEYLEYMRDTYDQISEQLMLQLEPKSAAQYEADPERRAMSRGEKNARTSIRLAQIRAELADIAEALRNYG